MKLTRPLTWHKVNNLRDLIEEFEVDDHENELDYDFKEEDDGAKYPELRNFEDGGDEFWEEQLAQAIMVFGGQRKLK